MLIGSLQTSWKLNLFVSLFFKAKADEIAKFMNENEHLKAVIEDLKVNMLLTFVLIGSFGTYGV